MQKRLTWISLYARAKCEWELLVFLTAIDSASAFPAFPAAAAVAVGNNLRSQPAAPGCLPRRRSQMNS